MYNRSASDTLDDYIDKFEGKTHNKYYTPKRVTDLLSPRRKFKPVETFEGGFWENMSKGNKALLKWINTSYKDNLESTCKPVYNQVRRAQLSENQNEFGSYITVSNDHRDINNHDVDDLSNLPSPERSDNELDSDQETITTEVLLRSCNTSQKQSKVASRNISEYPSWVEDVDQPVTDVNEVEFSRQFSSVSSLLKSSPPQDYGVASTSHDATGLTMDDTASIDTDVILQTSVYGEAPVNMGGSMHYPIFKDKRVEKLLNDSRIKKKKHNDNVLGRSAHSLSSSMQNHQSPQSRDVLYANQILDKHRRTDKTSYGRGRKVIGKTVDQISQKNGNSMVGNRRNEKNQPRDSKFQRNIDYLQAFKTVNKDSLTAEVAKIKIVDEKNSKTKVPKSRSSDKVTSKGQFSRQSIDNNSIRSSTIGTKQTYQSEANRYTLLIPKANDYVEQTSPRTSGYYSDMYLASPSTLPWSTSEEKSSSQNIHRSVPVSSNLNLSARRDSNLSESSVNTETLMRQSPTGTKMHQRSKTWASSSIRDKSPRAMSTPKHPNYQGDIPENLSTQRPYHMMPRNYRSNGGVVDARINSGYLLSKNSTRSAPSNARRSATTARSFVQSRSQFSRSPILSDNFAIAKNSYTRDVQTDREKNGTLTESRAINKVRGRQETNSLSSVRHQVTLQAKTGMNNSGGNLRSAGSEFHSFNRLAVSYEKDVGFQAGRNDEIYETEADNRDIPIDDADEMDKERLEDIAAEESDLNESVPDSHNRTWPSLERYKQKLKLVQSESSERSRPLHSGWVQEKRSIPLRSRNMIKTQTPLYKSSTTTYPTNQPLMRSVTNLEQRPYEVTNPNSNWRREKSLSNAERQVQPVNHDVDSDSITADTDILLVQPPMPIVDISPSLSTVSDDSTLTDSQSEADLPLYADLPLRSSSRVSFAPDVSNGGKIRGSPLTKSTLTNPRYVSTKDTRHMISVAGNIDATNNSDLEPKAMKSELLDSFIEDCMRSTNGITSKELSIGSIHKEDSRNIKLSGRDHPGTVETLKHMLLNLNGVAGGEQGDEPAQSSSLITTTSKQIDDNTDETSSLPGEQSLTRAYHHLERLKSLISNRTELSSDF